QPLRVILDPLLEIDPACALVRSAKEYPAMIMYHSADRDKIQSLEALGMKLKQVSGKRDELDLAEVMQTLWDMKLYSVLLETGNRLSEAFWKAKLVDKCVIFYGNQILGGDKSALKAYDRKNIDRALQLSGITVRKLQDNAMIMGYPIW
ncbi:MAG: dihydrofolate reductase family protein, partial [Candidatus Cloacimonetes bacterium]|nr:dihydrofolate reductase family protein [Candidatus Cloacimonadota bacterium]